jgi:rhodanese-related sulfurtransferase
MKKSAKLLFLWLFVSLSCLGGWTVYAQTSNSQHQVTVPATRRDDPLGIESSNETTAKSTNKLVGKGYDVLEPAKQSNPFDQFDPPKGDEIIKGTKIPRWDDTTPLPAKTPTTTNNSQKLKSKQRADEIHEQVQKMLARNAETSTPAKRSASDFLREAVGVLGTWAKTEWGFVVCGVTLGVLLIALCALIFSLLVRYVRRMKNILSKHSPQRIVLGLGVLLVILNGLFPLFEWTSWNYQKGWSYHQEGYRFLFAPPEGSKIIFTRFLVQFVTIIAATAGAFFLFGMRDKKETAQGKIQEAANQPVETFLKDERSDILPPAKPVTGDVQTAAPVRELTRPNSETLPVHEASENLAAQMADKTNDQLVEMLKQPDDWLPEALDVARTELQRRGIDTSTITVGPPLMPAGQHPIPAWQPSARILFRLRLVSALLLAASFFILLYVLIGSHGNTQKISDLLVNLVGKSGIAAFLLWFSFGKKKGFGVLLFAIFCFLFAVFIGWGVAKIKKEDASVEKLASNAVALMEQMTNSDNFTPQTTGNKNMDQVMSLLAKYGAFFKQLTTDMDSELQNVGEPNIYSEAILNDKEKIRVSISIQSKRQTIIETYRAKGHDGIERTALELPKMNISDSTAKGMVEGFNGTLEKAGPLMDEIFTLRSNMESAKAHFLQFMLERFGDYKSNGAAIVFSKNEDLKQYKALTKVVEDDTKAVDDWAAKQIGSANSAKERLKKMAQ